jgi:hypothetical protein
VKHGLSSLMGNSAVLRTACWPCSTEGIHDILTSDSPGIGDQLDFFRDVALSVAAI